MKLPRSVRIQNDHLRDELGSGPGGSGLYQWFWSEDLQMPMVMIDKDGQGIIDYVCRGCKVKNRSIHEDWCKDPFILSMPRYEYRSLVPDLHDCWVMARWVEPPSEENWLAAFGSEIPWPQNGTYAPVSSGRQMLHLKPGMVPLMTTTAHIILMIKEHRSKTSHELIDEIRDRQALRERQKSNELMDMVRDSLTCGLGRPGKKDPVEGGGWAGQTGIGESPTLRRFHGLFDGHGAKIVKGEA